MPYRVACTQSLSMQPVVSEVMKMGSIVPRVGGDPTYLAFWTSVLTITPHRHLDVTTLPTPARLCGSFPEKSV